MIRTSPGTLAALALVGAGLCGVLAWEVTTFPSLDGGPAERVSSRSARLPQGNEPGSRFDGWTHEILARPVFSPDRRPVEPLGRQVGGLRLTGIIVSDHRKVAIFAKAAGARAAVVEEGDEIDGAKVLEVTEAEVVLVGPNGRTVMRPIYDPTPRPKTSLPIPVPVKTEARP